MRIGLAVSRFSREVTERLLSGALACLDHHGGDAADRTVVHVPGAWELQLAAQRLARHGRHDAVLALGCLIRGETPHFDVLAHQVAAGLGRVGLDESLPVIFGVLTTENLEQALARSEDGPSNKGWEAALAAIEMVRGAGRAGD
jgi:6,7-dimethyl-8-ribityllumazine synthase